MSREPVARPRESAVLVPLYRDLAGAWRLVIVRRAEGGPHGGQLAFPGGARSEADADLVGTALREANEEIGLPAANVRVLARLPDVETRVSNFVVTPFLARIERPGAWVPDAREISEVLEPALGEFLAPQSRAFANDLLPAGLPPLRLPYYPVGPHRLWGTSERILVALLGRIAAGEWPELAPGARD
jgi:8-oxo-dGTP pyrophosphatase MutT (NUDIX family)